MYIETKEIDTDGIAIERTLSYSLPPAGKVEDEVRIGPVHLQGHLQKDGSSVAFAGDIRTMADLPCSRCLEMYSLPLDLHFDLLYTTEPEKIEKGESRVDESSITEVHYDGTRIDLDALFGEQILLGLPLKPLCREDCRGLCPQCGANLNSEACGCSMERDVDPRFAALKKLKTT